MEVGKGHSALQYFPRQEVILETDRNFITLFQASSGACNISLRFVSTALIGHFGLGETSKFATVDDKKHARKHIGNMLVKNMDKSQKAICTICWRYKITM